MPCGRKRGCSTVAREIAGSCFSGSRKRHGKDLELLQRHRHRHRQPCWPVRRLFPFFRFFFLGVVSNKTKYLVWHNSVRSHWLVPLYSLEVNLVVDGGLVG